MIRGLTLLLLAASLALVAGCADDNPQTEPLTIAGTYTDEWGTSHTISSGSWDQVNSGAFPFTATLDISTYSNSGQYAAGQNDADDTYNPSKYSRLDWTWFKGALYYCSTAFDKNSLEGAMATSSDSTDPSIGGCGGFAWTNLNPIAIAGTYTDEWGTSHTISTTSWGQVNAGAFPFTATLDFSTYSNSDQYAAGQNDAGDTYNPGKYSRIDWTTFGGNLYYCSSAYDKDTLDEALATSADRTDPTTGGCGGFAWTNLTP